MSIIRMTTLLCSIAISQAAVAAELVHQFSSPAFSGAGYSAHVLTIEQTEAQRRQKIKDDKQAAKDKAERDAKNTYLAKLIVNQE